MGDVIMGVSAQERHRHEGLNDLWSEADAAICPNCGAGPGELCINLSGLFTGRHVPIPHPARSKLAERQRGIPSEPPVLGS